MSPVFTNAVLGFEYALLLVGIVLLWRYVVSPKARAQARPAALPGWEADASDFILLIGLILVCTFFAAVSANGIVKVAHIKGDLGALLAGAAGQFGMVVGTAIFALRSPTFRKQAPATGRSILRSGAATFIIALPLLQGTSEAWTRFLQLFRIPAEKQDLIRMFAEANSPGLLVALIVLAIVIAPVAEELVFRAGIFRFIRTRAPRPLAILIPAVLFASLHVNWSTLEGLSSFAPLLVFAVIFSLAYERTGHIGTTIVAHALFNLNTIVQILSGVASQ
jgi:membrane protease YdiL (CAAX protease family)